MTSRLHAARLLALTFTTACLTNEAVPPDPGDPPPVATTPQAIVTPFVAGSLVIPMDTTHQDRGALRAYGLVYRLLVQGVPVQWIALAGKPDQGVDFTIAAGASVVNRETGAAVTLPAAYRGGPFVVAAADRAAALPIIDAWLAADAVTVVHDLAGGGFSADIRRTLTAAPRIAVFQDGAEAIAYADLNAAGIPDSAGQPWAPGSVDELTEAELAGTSGSSGDGVLNTTDAYCHLTSMHYNGGTARTNEIVREVRRWLDDSPATHAFMQCEAITTFENNGNGRFITTSGLSGTSAVPGPLVNRAPSNLLNQYHGPIFGDDGSVAAFFLPLFGSFRANTQYLIDDPALLGGSIMWVSGYLDGNVANGKVTYLGGHDFTTTTPISMNARTNGVRLLLNSLMESGCVVASGQPNLQLAKSAPALEAGNTITYTLSYANTGPGPALGVTITDPVPAGTTFQSATGGGTHAAGVVTWNLGTVASGASGSVSFTVAVTANGTYTNTATAQYLAGTTPRTVTSNTTTTLRDTSTPVARDDAFTVAEDSSTALAVRANDTGLNDTPIAAVVSDPGHGTATANADGTIQYAPDADYHGADSFTYTLTDATQQSATATVTVTVTPVDDVPVANPDTSLAAVDTPDRIDVLANDTGIGDAPLVVTATDPARGATIVNADLTVTYTPDPGATGTDTFAYTVRDADGQSATATVTVTIGADVDGDGLSDAEEEAIGTDPNDSDSDDDGLLDGDEPTPGADSDGDGLVDGNDPDADNDGLFDGTEAGVTTPPAGTDVGEGNFVPDSDPTTTTDPTDPDTDDGGVRDGAEDADHDGAIDPGETDPNDPSDDVRVPDADGDGLSDAEEDALGTDPDDADSDDDGVRDGAEANPGADTDGDGLINALDHDSDNDGIFDGTETGVTEPAADTDVGAGHFVPDGDPDSTTSPVNDDTDGGGVPDGLEDADHDGVRDDGERDPNDPRDDVAPDLDGDGVPDDVDNCPDATNDGQGDADGDGLGDACDADADGNGFDDGVGISGGGCAAGGAAGQDAGLVVLIALTGIALSHRRPRRRRTAGAARVEDGGAARRSVGGGGAVIVVGLALAAAAGDARAQEASEPRDFSVERFSLATAPDGVLGVEAAGLTRPWDWDVHLWLGTANDPLVVYMEDTGDRLGSLVHTRTGGALGGSLVLHDRVGLGVDVPLIVSQDRADTVSGVNGMLPGLGGVGLGDLRLTPKLRLLRQQDVGVDVALVPEVVVPTASGEDYRGDDGVGVTPSLAVSRRDARVRWAVNVGYAVRPRAELAGLVVDDELRGKAGLAVGVAGGVELAAMLSVATAAAEPFGDFARDHLELVAGPAIAVGGWQVFAAGGAGAREGYGTPDWRALAGVRLAGVGKARPAPEPIAEVVPPPPPADLDADDDGILDAVDRCPTEPETRNGFQDEDGCPDELDTDGDGLADSRDRCPTEPEDVDGFQDDDGCPEDDDGDGLADAVDACPREAGPPENRGCPDRDRDGDGLVDRLDNCPDEPGPAKNFGCRAKQLAVIRDGAIEILDIVYFKTNRDVIQKRSYKLLGAVAAVIRNHPEIAKIIVEGHTDDVGDDAYNLDLSSRRAGAVRAFLMGKGIAGDRLEARGFGETRPLVPKTDKKSRAANRRVEFKIEAPPVPPAPAK